MSNASQRSYGSSTVTPSDASRPLHEAEPWDAADQLRMHNPATEGWSCVGYATSLGRRCQRQIKRSNIDLARHILRRLRRMALRPTDPAMQQLLFDLADKMLCLRDHHRDQQQHNDIVHTWQNRIRRLRRQRGSNPSSSNHSSGPSSQRNGGPSGHASRAGPSNLDNSRGTGREDGTRQGNYRPPRASPAPDDEDGLYTALLPTGSGHSSTIPRATEQGGLPTPPSTPRASDPGAARPDHSHPSYDIQIEELQAKTREMQQSIQTMEMMLETMAGFFRNWVPPQ
ncbi:hypothetical protein NA57DRAFT_73600 [Rhizodiscina lignyota]|uniref:Uncharacterized protein n=1 Tax=Rhizodiscina lignyota TaxID=1504668 RepID=A0A9P4IPI4_9PEZI|nr:hypothetical protein NA57DRAFT_73600 [Rhizodiscina lignyota]